MRRTTTVRRLTVWRDDLRGRVTRLVKRKPHKLHMGSWCSGEDPGICTTSACVGGFATTIPAFRKAGLYLKYTGRDFSASPAIRGKSWLDGVEALAEFFGTSGHEMTHITMPRNYSVSVKGIKLRHVIPRITALIRQYEKAQ